MSKEEEQGRGGGRTPTLRGADVAWGAALESEILFCHTMLLVPNVASILSFCRFVILSIFALFSCTPYGVLSLIKKTAVQCTLYCSEAYVVTLTTAMLVTESTAFVHWRGG
jgi:hypothetical protein